MLVCPRGAFRSALLVVASAVAVFAGHAHGEVVERHAPPPPAVTRPVLPSPPRPEVAEDDRPLGADLRAIVLLGATDPVASVAPQALSVSSSLTNVDSASLLRTLAGFIGQPITRKLISRIESAVVHGYRRSGYPFVEISTPEQEIGQGVLNVRVVEFRFAAMNVTGAGPREAGRIEHSIRLARGDAINSPRLTQDLDWLARYPFRSIAPAFTPGAELGETDLDLTVTHRRPWQAQAGYANNGATPNSQDRYFIGATIGGLVVRDSVVSVQVTGSPDFWISQGDVFGQPHPAYESVSGRVTTPTEPRQDIELSIDGVETNQPAQAFLVREQTLEASLAYRSALSNIVSLPGDVRLGLEVQSQRRKTFFGPTDVLNGGVNIYQVFGGWSDSWSDRSGRASLDLAIHGAPGGVDRLNSDANLSDFTMGRVTGAGYVYGDLTYARTTQIGRGFSWSAQLNGQYAGRPLPDSQQIGLGGPGAVRGYFLDVGAFDDAVILRDEIHGPSVAAPFGGSRTSQIGSFVFVDAGYGRNDATRQNVDLASVGLGASLQFFAAIGSLTLCLPLVSAHETEAGSFRLEASVSVSY